VGDKLDICFEFDLASAILSSAAGGYASTVASVMTKVDDLYPPQQYATFLTNHDQERVMSVLRKNEDQARVAASIYLTLPGVPFVYYGEEIGMTGQKPDERIRTPMQWTGDPGAGFTTASRPWYPINGDYQHRSVEAQAADKSSLLNHYRTLIRLRSSYDALRTGGLLTLQSQDLYVYAYLRHGQADRETRQDVLVIHNLSGEPTTDYGLTLRASDLKPGKYRAVNLLDGTEGARLTVGDKGAIDYYAPFPALDASQSYILLLRR
jgi:glycosidase